MELQADIMDGWFIAYQFDHSVADPAIRAAEEFYRQGDYNFNSPTHHGTNEQRANAYWYGYNLYEKGYRGLLDYL